MFSLRKQPGYLQSEDSPRSQEDEHQSLAPCSQADSEEEERCALVAPRAL